MLPGSLDSNRQPNQDKPVDHVIDQLSLCQTNILLWGGRHASDAGSGQSRVRTKRYLYILNGPASFKVTAGFLPELKSQSLSVRVMEMIFQHEGETYCY